MQAHPTNATSALVALIAGMAVAARSSALGPLKRGANTFLAEPWRLERVVPGIGDIRPDARGHAVRRRKDVMRELGRRAHHAYDANMMLALRQAYIAVRVDQLRRRASPIVTQPEAPVAATDRSTDPGLAVALVEHERLRRRVSRARTRLSEIDARLHRRMGLANRAALRGRIITGDDNETAAARFGPGPPA